MKKKKKKERKKENKKKKKEEKEKEKKKGIEEKKKKIEPLLFLYTTRGGYRYPLPDNIIFPCICMWRHCRYNPLQITST